MGANVRYDSSAVNQDMTFKAGFQRGQRGNLICASLDRSRSFREINEGRVFSSDAGIYRGNSTSTSELPPLPQCLVLDPISIGDQRYARPGELRRVLGLSVCSNSQEYSNGASHSKSPPSSATGELKRFKASIVDATLKARNRSRKLDDSLYQLNKYCEALNTKKQLKSDMILSNRSGGSNLLKMATQIHQYPPELANQKLEERSKNIILQKRVRTSLAETQADGKSNNGIKKAAIFGKERDLPSDGCGASVVEEKIRKVPAGGETWDKKMKRKRSMGAVIGRHVDGNGEQKRVMHLKLHNESGLQFSEPQDFRKDFKADVASTMASSNVSAAAKNELDKVSKDTIDGANQDRIAPKGSRFTICENNQLGCAYALPKGKGSRAPRAGFIMGGNLSPVLSHSSGPPEVWVPSTEGNKVHSVSSGNNRKRPLSIGSSSPPMAQWVGQRPQKISRTRRVNLVSPLLDSEEMQIPLDDSSAADITARTTSLGVNDSLFSLNANSTSQQDKVQLEYHSSPARLLESDEAGAGKNVEGRLKENGSGINELEDRTVNDSLNFTSSISLSKRNKLKKEVADVLHRQERNARRASVSRASISPPSENLKSSTPAKPFKSMKPALEKNGSKSGCPRSKKPDQKAVSHLCHTSTQNSLDFAGAVDDDHEDLLTAGNLACDASYLGCSSSFWKKMELVSGPVSLDGVAFLKQLLKSTEDTRASLTRLPATNDGSMDCQARKDDFLSQPLIYGETGRSFNHQLSSTEVLADMDGKFPNIGVSHRTVHKQAVTPLYQRVLSALIIEDQVEEDLILGERNMSPLDGRDDVRVVAYRPMVSAGCKPESGIHDQPFDNELLQVQQESMDSDVGVLSMFTGIGNEELKTPFTYSSCTLHCDHDQLHLEEKLMMELQCVGLSPSLVPDLMDGEDEAISEEIIQLEKQLQQQLSKKEAHLKRLIQSVENEREREQKALEQVAMDKLVELAYKKKLATRGSSAMRLGVPKVSKQIALAFMKRTLSRCQKYEGMGKSCFVEPTYRESLFTTPNHCSEEESLNCLDPVQQSGQSGLDALGKPSDQDIGRTGPMVDRGKKKELLLDDVGVTASFRASTVNNSLLAGPKGKRSERERGKDTSGKDSNKGDRATSGYIRGERRTRAKPKQKTAQLSTAGTGYVSKFTEATNSENPSAGISTESAAKCDNRKSDPGPASHNPKNSLIELEDPIYFGGLQLQEFVSMDVGVDNELGGHPDLDSWLNIDVDNLQDHNSEGLDIPMDDLSDLNMLLT